MTNKKDELYTLIYTLSLKTLVFMFKIVKTLDSKRQNSKGRTNIHLQNKEKPLISIL